MKEKTLDYRFRIMHVPGKLNLEADAASRYPTGKAEQLKLQREPETEDDVMVKTEIRDIIHNRLLVEETEPIKTEVCMLAVGTSTVHSIQVTTWGQSGCTWHQTSQ